MAFMITAMHSPSASRISLSSMVMVLGTPSIRLRPLISIVMRLVQRIGRADFDLDLLGGAFADEQVVLALEVVGDGLVHLVAGHAHGTRIDDAATAK